jgi:predicted ATPase
MDAAQCAEKGLLIRRVLDLMGALKLGVRIGLDQIRADEFCAMLIIAEQRALVEREKSPALRGGGHT